MWILRVRKFSFAKPTFSTLCDHFAFSLDRLEIYLSDPLGSDFAVTLHRGNCEPLNKMIMSAIESEYVFDDPSWVVRKLMERYIEDAKQELNLVREQAVVLQDFSIALASNSYDSSMQREQDRLGVLRSCTRELLRHSSARAQIVNSLLRWRERLLGTGYRVCSVLFSHMPSFLLY